MPNEEYTKAEFLRSLLNRQKQLLNSGGSLVNPAIGQDDLGQMASLTTGVQQPVQQEKEVSGFDQFMNNVLGFVDEIAAKFGAGFVAGWEGGLDLIATGLGALGWEDAAEWAKQDIGTQASEWMKSAFGLGSWYNRARNGFQEDELKDLGESFLDWNKAAFFAKNDLGDLRSEISDKYYGGNDEVLSQMNLGDFKAGEFLGGVAHSVGMMLPSIMTAGAAGAAGAGSAVQKGVSLATLGIGAAGKGSEEALNEGASAKQALGYGALSGGAEVLSELAVGPVLAKVGLGTGKIMGVVGGKTVKATSKSFIKELAKNAFEEGMEEVSTALVEPLLKSIYKGSDSLKDYGTDEFWFKGNDSVLGQFASGAFTGGLMSGVSVAQQSKTFGKEGRNVVSSISEARESYAKMRQYAEGTASYNKYMEETLEHLGEAVEAWNGAQGQLSEQQLKNLQQYIQNPGDFMRSVKENRDSGEIITEYMNELKNGEEISMTKFGARETARAIFKAADSDKYSIEFGKPSNNANAEIKGDRIIIKESMADQAGKFLAHEFGVHALSNSIGNEQIDKLYKKIVDNKWFETKEGKATDRVYKDEKRRNFKLYKEEIVANYLQDIVESKGGTQTQLQYVQDLFSKPSFLQKFLRKFNKNSAKFPSNSAIETEFRNTIQNVVKASNNRVYKSVISKLRKGEKLNSEEATAYRGIKDVFDLFKPEEVFSKNRKSTVITKEEFARETTKHAKDLIGKKTSLDFNIDSKGNVLSKQQQEFFKDSKIRDNEGKLLVVYHFTNNEFDTFKYSKNKSKRLDFGKAFYFTNIANDENVRGYGAIRKDCYLNLVNPLIIDAKGTGVKSHVYDDVDSSWKKEWSKYIKDNNMFSLSYAYEMYFHKAKKQGNDGIIIYNVADYSGSQSVNYSTLMTVYIAFNENQIKDVDNKNPTENEDIRYSKDRVVGNYTVGANKKKLVVRRAPKGGYEIYFPSEQRTITEAEIGGEWADNGKGVNVRVNGNTVKFTNEKNVLAYLEDIGAKRVERQTRIDESNIMGTFDTKEDATKELKELREKDAKNKYYIKEVDGKFEVIRKIQKLDSTVNLIGKKAPTEAELKKADNKPLSKISLRKAIWVNDGSRIFKYLVKKVDKNSYQVKYENENGELIEKDFTRKGLIAELNTYTNISNKKSDVEFKKVKPEQKAKPKAEKTKSKVEVKKAKEEVKQTKLKGVKLSEKVYVSDGKNVLEYEISKGKKQGDRVVKVTDKNGKTETKTVKYAEARKELNNYRKVSNVREDVAPKKSTYKSLETTGDIIKQSIEIVEKMLGDNYKVVAPINLQDFTKRTFTDINSVQDVELEAKRLVGKLLETRIENSNRELVGTLEEMLDDAEITALENTAKEIIESSPNTEARTRATRAFEIQLEKAQAEAKEFKEGQSRTRVLTRQVDRTRNRIAALSDVAKNKDLANGYNKLASVFAEIHGNEKGFGAKGFANRLAEVLEWYTEENIAKTNFFYDDYIRTMLQKTYDLLGYGVERGNVTVYKDINTETMQQAIETLRLISQRVNENITKARDYYRPASISTMSAMKRSGYGQTKNFVSRLLRKYKRGFAPSYVVLEEVFGGSSEATRLLITEMQIAFNKQLGYVREYHGQINKELKQLGLKKTFDSKKINVGGVEMSVDQAMGLYLSTKVEANYNAINESGAVLHDTKYDRYVSLAEKGGAEALKAAVEQALPENYKKFADWLLDKMNTEVKSDYKKYLVKRFGEMFPSNAIGELSENAYWSLKRKYDRMTNLTKAVSNPDAIFSNSISRKGGNNEVLITGALGTFDAYINRLGRDYFVKPVYEDAIQVLNIGDLDGKSIMNTLSSNVDQSKEIKYVKDTLADMLGVNQREATLIDKMVSAFSVSKLALNIGSMLKQHVSLYTSNLPLRKSTKTLLNRMFNGSEMRAEMKTLIDGVKNADGSWKVEPLWGLKYREANKNVLRANADKLSGLTEKIAEKGMFGITKIDMLTVTAGVYTLMTIGQDQFNAKIGTQANIDFVKEHWNEFELSQIGNSALSKNYISRSADSLVRYLFGFLQGANRAALGSTVHKWNLWERNHKVNKTDLQNGLKEANKAFEDIKVEYEADPENEALREEYIKALAEVKDFENRLQDYKSYEIAGGKAIPVNTAAGILAQGIMVALINSLMKRIKGRKDWDELDVAEEALALAKSIFFDWVPFVNFVANIVQGYEVDIPAINLFNQMSEIFKSGNAGNWNTTIRQMILLVGDMTGIPFQTLYQYVYGTLKMFDPATAYEMRSVLYGASIQSATTTMKTYADKGNVKKTASMIDLIMKKFKTGSSSDEINNELARLYIAGYNALPKGTMTEYKDDDGNVVKLTAQQITQFMKEYEKSTQSIEKLLRITEYKNLTAEEQSKAIKKLYDAYYSMAQVKIIGAKPEGKLAQMLVLTNGNIDLAKYVIYLQKVGQITDSAKKTRKELVLEYINKLTGFTKAEKAMLMYLAGYKVNGTSSTLLYRYLVSNGANQKEAKEIMGL